MALTFDKFSGLMPNEFDFHRMRGYNDSYEYMSYEQFLQWNESCFNQASDADRNFLNELSQRLRIGTIRLVDMECCVEMSASGIYFNAKGRIAIFNER